MTDQSHTFLTEPEIQSIRAITNRASIRQMAKEAAAAAGVRFEDLIGPSRRADLCRIREVVYGSARRHGYSTTQTARVFRRDHTTIINGLRNLDRRTQA